MEEPQEFGALLLGSAAVACVSCRKLKMRCIGSNTPPCARCAKSGRECRVRLPNRQQRRSSSRLKAHVDRRDDNLSVPIFESQVSPAVSGSPASSFLLSATTSQSQQQLSFHVPHPLGAKPAHQTGLPSIFSASPITITTGPGFEADHLLDTISPRVHDGSDQPSQAIIHDLVEFFVQRLLLYTPVLSLEDMDRLDIVIATRQPLAYAMAFVASNFALGYASTRKYLNTQMSKILDQANDVMNNSEEENWTLLQALAVLYAYPQVSITPKGAGGNRLTLWAVKSAVETCAMQLSIHQSIEHLKDLAQSGTPEISSSLSYRRTFYWVWLFVKSRHHSIITRTPPTIHNDTATISALDLLLSLNPSPSVWRVLAEAALHRVWDQAACSDKGLGEWWCTPPHTKNVKSLQELLDNVDKMLLEWSSTWQQSSDLFTRKDLDFNLFEPSVFVNSITNFMGVLTRFSIFSFVVPIIAHQLSEATGSGSISSSTSLSPEISLYLSCVLKSANAASKCCDAIIDLKPAAREFLRYTPDYGFTMMALCCLHLVYTYNMFPGNITLKNYLVKVEQIAHLMLELPVACNTCPKMYGEYVLFHLRNASSCTTMSVNDSNQDQTITNLHPWCPSRTYTQIPAQIPMTHTISEPVSYNEDSTYDSWLENEPTTEDAMFSLHSEMPGLCAIYSDMIQNSNTNQL